MKSAHCGQRRYVKFSGIVHLFTTLPSRTWPTSRCARPPAKQLVGNCMNRGRVYTTPAEWLPIPSVTVAMSGGRTTYRNAVTGPAGSALGASYPGTAGNSITVKDYGAMVEPFFGPPSKPIADNTDSRYPHEAFFLQDAYNGRNDYIRQTIVYAVVNQNSFMTKYILPWRNQENPNIAWEKVQFNRTLMDLEPEQGVPRYVTVEKEAHSDKMVRRGLALIVNHGFAATPGGQNDWAWKMATIAGAMQETCDQDGLLTLLGCKDIYKALREPPVFGASEENTKMIKREDRELFQFGIVQREDRGWISLDAEAEYEMRLQHVQPDSWIVPPRMLNFVALGQPAETEYYRAGEEARANLRRGGDNFATFRGKKVFETKPYSLDVDGRHLDPLTRERMIGDYFIEFDDTTTEVYCCETDKFQSRVGAPYDVPLLQRCWSWSCCCWSGHTEVLMQLYKA